MENMVKYENGSFNLPFHKSATVNFKNEKLQSLTIRVNGITDSIGTTLNATQIRLTECEKAIASVLATVKKEALYKEDGFKSVAEYASVTFGMKEAYAYKLARAGEIYDNPEINESVKALSPSTIDELSQLTTDEINKGVEDGSIDLSAGQKAIRAGAARIKESRPEDEEKARKPKVVSTYDIMVVYGKYRGHFPSIILDDFTSILENISNVKGWQEILSGKESVTGNVPESDRRKVKAFACSDGVALVYYSKHIDPKQEKPEKVKNAKIVDVNSLSYEELLKLAAAKKAKEEEEG